VGRKVRQRMGTPRAQEPVPSSDKPGLPSSSQRLDADNGGGREQAWPRWARVVTSAAILWHGAGVLAGALGVPPSSELERRIADLFTPYFELFDFGYAYRFYSEPPPTPIITATIEYRDGRDAEILRLPGREVAGPRMRHQRQLALANALAGDVQAAKEQVGDRSSSRLAVAYARHLCANRPGCRSVTLRLQYHLTPEIDQVRQAAEQPGAPPFDLFAESLFTAPERIGDFACKGD
jgi:hypothetical protein